MTDLGFGGRVAVVTGAGGGLGREHALLLASRGARVVVNDTGGSTAGEGSDNGPAEDVTREIRDQGGEAVADPHSVATPEGGQGVIRTALDAYGRVDIVVNNAGILRDAAFHDMTTDLLDPVLDVHLKGAFFVTRSAWTTMREQGYGRVVNTTSAAGLLGTANKSNYGAAKTGLIGLTRVLAAEGAAHNIKVNAVAPIALTRMLTQALTKTGAAEERKAEPAANAMTAERMRSFVDRLDPALVAPVVAYLAHADCAVSGDMYTVGAGHVARFFLGRTKGYFNPDLSMEDVRDHFAEIRDETGYTVPGDQGDETAQLFKISEPGDTPEPRCGDQETSVSQRSPAPVKHSSRVSTAAIGSRLWTATRVAADPPGVVQKGVPIEWWPPRWPWYGGLPPGAGPGHGQYGGLACPTLLGSDAISYGNRHVGGHPPLGGAGQRAATWL